MRQNIKTIEVELDDDAEGIIANERYVYITAITKAVIQKHRKGLTVSDKIDRVVTNRWLALPIFVLVMFCHLFCISYYSRCLGYKLGQ